MPGCILSPCLFNLYAEYIMRNTGLDEAQAGIKIAGRNISNFRYANDPTLTAESEEELSLLMKVKEREKGAPHPGRVCPSLWLPGPLRPRREKARRTRGEGAQASGCLNRSGRGRHKTQVQPNPPFCGGPENRNRTQRRARSI